MDNILVANIFSWMNMKQYDPNLINILLFPNKVKSFSREHIYLPELLSIPNGYLNKLPISMLVISYYFHNRNNRNQLLKYFHRRYNQKWQLRNSNFGKPRFKSSARTRHIPYHKISLDIFCLDQWFRLKTYRIMSNIIY